MTALRPFFLLAGRASVFWIGLIQLFVVSVLVLGLAEPDSRLAPHVDAIFLAAFGFPTAVGWIAGTVVQEFQHTSFAMVLPRVRTRVAPGFLFAGLVVSGIVTALIGLNSSTPQNLPLLFVIGVGAYCFGSIFIDPLSVRITSLNVILTLLVVGASQEVSRVAHAHPWTAAAVAAAVGGVGLYRLFARSTFRSKPFRGTSRLPGRFSLEKSQKDAVERMIRDRPKGTSWRAGYLGTGAWRWVRAAVHEVHGPRRFKSVTRTIGRAWGLLLVVVIYAWADKGELGFGEALARAIHDALFRSPHVPQFGEKGGPYLLVALGLATAGALTAMFAPVALYDAITHPLSRRQRARVHFRGGLIDAGIFLLLVAPGLFVLGHLMGWLVGHETRFDFMPFYLRPLLITVILMPLAHWGRLRLLAATRRKSENTLLGVVVGITGFVIAVGVATLISAASFRAPLAELVALIGALAVSQLLYRQMLMSHYRTADLA
jgi:hypothetical protein